MNSTYQRKINTVSWVDDKNQNRPTFRGTLKRSTPRIQSVSYSVRTRKQKVK